MANLSSKTGTVTTPVQAQISLANNAATSVQDMTAYDSQEVTGFVYVDATTDYRASFKVTVNKNGAGSYEIVASDIAGDDISGAPIISFSMSGSVLRVTLPSFAGFSASTSYLRYQLSAPYLGGNYPLSVSASQVLGNISGSVSAGYIGQELTLVPTSNQNITNTGTWYNVFGSSTTTALTLTPGVWLVYGTIVYNATSLGSGTLYSADAAISTLSNNFDDTSKGFARVHTKDTGITSAGLWVSPAPRYFNVTSSTPIYLVANLIGSAATTTGCQATTQSRLTAVRVG